MVIAPEGTRSSDGKLLESKEGLMFIAKRVPEAWFMPCAVEGTPAFKLRFPDVLRRPRVKLTYGRPFRLRWPSGTDAARIDRKLLGELTRAAMDELAALLPPEMRGAYAEPDESASRWIEYGV
jgi:1-acyl-sn-glycerol-3-phosphate acyltransferase